MISFDPLAKGRQLAPKRRRREMQTLFGMVLAATVAALSDEEEELRAQQRQRDRFDPNSAQRVQMLRRQNLQMSRVALLTLGALAAAAGRLWHGLVKSTVEPYLGSQVGYCGGDACGGVGWRRLYPAMEVVGVVGVVVSRQLRSALAHERCLSSPLMICAR